MELKEKYSFSLYFDYHIHDVSLWEIIKENDERFEKCWNDLNNKCDLSLISITPPKITSKYTNTLRRVINFISNDFVIEDIRLINNFIKVDSSVGKIDEVIFDKTTPRRSLYLKKYDKIYSSKCSFDFNFDVSEEWETKVNDFKLLKIVKSKIKKRLIQTMMTCVTRMTKRGLEFHERWKDTLRRYETNMIHNIYNEVFFEECLVFRKESMKSFLSFMEMLSLFSGKKQTKIREAMLGDITITTNINASSKLNY